MVKSRLNSIESRRISDISCSMTMPLTALNALSPLDGRYASKTDALRPILSEAGFMHHRVKVEIAWLLALSEAGFTEIPNFSASARQLLEKLASDFTEEDAAIESAGKSASSGGIISSMSMPKMPSPVLSSSSVRWSGGRAAAGTGSPVQAAGQRGLARTPALSAWRIRPLRRYRAATRAARACRPARPAPGRSRGRSPARR